MESPKESLLRKPPSTWLVQACAQSLWTPHPALLPCHFLIVKRVEEVQPGLVGSGHHCPPRARPSSPAYAIFSLPLLLPCSPIWVTSIRDLPA